MKKKVSKKLTLSAATRASGSSLRSYTTAAANARNSAGYRRPTPPPPERATASRNLFTRASMDSSFREAQNDAP